jgi:hypothetical protein
MTYMELDFIFPFIVFGYGAVMLFVLNNTKLMDLAEKRLPSEVLSQFHGKRLLSAVCFVVGGLWSLQNLWAH